MCNVVSSLTLNYSEAYVTLLNNLIIRELTSLYKFLNARALYDKYLLLVHM